ncbi:MAG: hypothetical protein GY702_09300 [Desulfobulbaceae bacterium]|nr:hypothetical protein [Desulfobulbaceae bacterium]
MQSFEGGGERLRSVYVICPAMANCLQIDYSAGRNSKSNMVTIFTIRPAMQKNIA